MSGSVVISRLAISRPQGPFSPAPRRIRRSLYWAAVSPYPLSRTSTPRSNAAEEPHYQADVTEELCAGARMRNTGPELPQGVRNIVGDSRDYPEERAARARPLRLS